MWTSEVDEASNSYIWPIDTDLIGYMLLPEIADKLPQVLNSETAPKNKKDAASGDKLCSCTGKLGWLASFAYYLW